MSPPAQAEYEKCSGWPKEEGAKRGTRPRREVHQPACEEKAWPMRKGEKTRIYRALCNAQPEVQRTHGGGFQEPLSRPTPPPPLPAPLVSLPPSLRDLPPSPSCEPPAPAPCPLAPDPCPLPPTFCFFCPPLFRRTIWSPILTTFTPPPSKLRKSTRSTLLLSMSILSEIAHHTCVRRRWKSQVKLEGG